MKRLLRIIWTLIKIVMFAIGGVFILGVLLVVVAAIVASGKHGIADKTVLVFNMNTAIVDRPPDEKALMISRLLGNNISILQLREATTALRDAAQDSRISGLYLYGNLRAGNYSSGYGALKELRQAILDFEKSGKPVIAYIGEADNRDYFIQSAANQILLSPEGSLGFRGLAVNGVFLKGAADKYGVEFTPIRHGKYKSAIEPLTRENFSPDNREQIEAFVGSIWNDVRDSVADSRKIATNELQKVVDHEGLISAEVAKKTGLVTDLAYQGEALDKLRQLAGKTTKDKTFPQITLEEYAETHRSNVRLDHGRDKIAIVYAEGEIIEGEGKQDGSTEVAGDRYARIIRELRQRDDVKAIVLRVNSPGGSGEASDVIWGELRRFNEDRPVIVSMGTVAASGGYYISTASRRILAEPGTITGSIGVFGLTMDVQKIANDHGITFDAVKTGDLANLGTVTRPMTPPEHEVIENLVNHFYDVFLQRVAASRKMTTNHVDEMAQGRVWSGSDALTNGLVDELGGLHEALAVAAQDAKLGTNYSVIEFPAPKTFAEEISESLKGRQSPLAENKFADRVMQIVMQEWSWLSSLNDPRGIYMRLPFDADLN